MTIIFKAKSNEAYCLKILAELLTNNIKTGCFELDETGISLCMMDTNRKILIDLKLHAENFLTYKFRSRKMYLGINLNHLHKMLKAIKKKDLIELFIDDQFPNELGIKVIPKENNRFSTSTIMIQTIQNLIIEVPIGYKNPISVASPDYQKMCKEMGSISNTIKITSKSSKMVFDSNAGGVIKRKVQFGNIDDDEEGKEEYTQDFATEQLCRITKLSGLSNHIQIFTGNPLMFRTNIGNLGKISIYIKSINQIESESLKTACDDDSENDD